MFRCLCASIAFALVPTSVSYAQSIKTTGKVEWKTCAGTSTVLTDKGICYVVDMANNQSKWVIDLCAGVNVNMGTIMLGGRASTLLCTTVEVAGAKNKADALVAAQDWLNKSLKEDTHCRALLKELGSKDRITTAEPASIKDEAPVARVLKDAQRTATKRP